MDTVNKIALAEFVCIISQFAIMIAGVLVADNHPLDGWILFGLGFLLNAAGMIAIIRTLYERGL